MSNADRLKDYLSDFKKSASNSTSISITSGDDDSTASLLGGISSWSKTGFSDLKHLKKAQEEAKIKSVVLHIAFLGFINLRLYNTNLIQFVIILRNTKNINHINTLNS